MGPSHRLVPRTATHLSEPDESKIKALATKLGRKLQEMGENVAIGVIDSLLRSRMGF